MEDVTDINGIIPREVNPSFFEKLDYIPLISTITGIVRIAFGIFEVAIGFCLFPWEIIRSTYTGRQCEFTLIQGGLNILRGYVATRPFVGNIGLYLFDCWNLSQSRNRFYQVIYYEKNRDNRN